MKNNIWDQGRVALLFACAYVHAWTDRDAEESKASTEYRQTVGPRSIKIEFDMWITSSQILIL